MRAFSLGLLVMVTLASWSLAVEKKRFSLDEPLHDIAVTEDGTVYVTSDNHVIQWPKSTNTFGLLAPASKPSSLKSFKKNIFYVQDGGLFQLAGFEKPNTPGKQLVTKEALSKAVGTPCSIQTMGFDANGQTYLLVVDDNKQGGIVKRSQQGGLTTIIAPGAVSELSRPVSMTVAGETTLLVQGEGQQGCNLLCLMQKKVIGTIPLGNVTSVTYDYFGRLYAVDPAKNAVVVQTHPQAKVQPLKHEFDKVVAVAYDPASNTMKAIDAGSNRIVTLPTGDPTNPVDESPLPLKVAPAFPNIEWANWEPVNDKGIAVPLRPLLLTHANDNSGRNFVGTEHGVVYVFPNKPDVKETKVFLDIQNQVSYKDSQNEEGFLGLAFHPKYKENGEFFVNYTKKPGLLTVVSRFKVSKDDPNKADPTSEQVLFTLKKPMWNHSGGTICFGPDGYLYVVFGDGGGANDMFKNSRKMDTFHSKIIRIDVDTKSDGKAYGIPKDNPFVGKEGFAPEIFCYGVRNPWRMSFDRKTGQGWFADVGQNLYEEINLLQKGGDYGWSHRESFHPFGPKSLPVNDKMIEPIWEYNHILGKSITGGFVYRGKQFPELDGWYLYADYVSGKIWALKYDFEKKRVVANREIANRGLPIMSFGEDENGELYLMTFSASGQGIDRIVRK